ncbi:unnamed protein product, partial [Amoebophrya sp. A120]
EEQHAIGYSSTFQNRSYRSQSTITRSRSRSNRLRSRTRSRSRHRNNWRWPREQQEGARLRSRSRSRHRNYWWPREPQGVHSYDYPKGANVQTSFYTTTKGAAGWATATSWHKGCNQPDDSRARVLHRQHVDHNHWHSSSSSRVDQTRSTSNGSQYKFHEWGYDSYPDRTAATKGSSATEAPTAGVFGRPAFAQQLHHSRAETTSYGIKGLRHCSQGSRSWAAKGQGKGQHGCSLSAAKGTSSASSGKGQRASGSRVPPIGETGSSFFLENQKQPSENTNTRPGCSSSSQSTTASGSSFAEAHGAATSSCSGGEGGGGSGLVHHDSSNSRQSTTARASVSTEDPAALNRTLSSGTTTAGAVDPQKNSSRPKWIIPLQGVASGLGLYKVKAWKPEGITEKELAELERMTRLKMGSLKRDYHVPRGLQWWETFDEGAPRAAAQLEAKLFEAGATWKTVRGTGTTEGTYDKMGMKQYKTAAAAILQDHPPAWGYARHAALVLAAVKSA